MKKIIMMLLFLIGVIVFSEEEFSYKGYDLPFTNDGKLYENILLKTEISSDDMSIRIKKLKNGKYQFWDYASDTGSENETPQVTDAVLKKNMLCDEYICVGYDTKLKVPVILNVDTKRIIHTVRPDSYNKIDDPNHLKEFPDDNPEMYKLYRDYYKLYK